MIHLMKNNQFNDLALSAFEEFLFMKYFILWWQMWNIPGIKPPLKMAK